ncbi:MAG: acetyl-CoA carboxylase biotin carboxylase subunit [Nitriliruptorales bacterium]|nr:acetyl-CoA carboxylase biotin carboxylase subunit [Nitriliruptorales bacterium]
MFDAVLVANRGEIALRVLRGCRELDIRTIGVFSEADRDAPWLRAADEAHLLGPEAPAESYLNIERVLDVATSAGASAIHPGYGFLAENADFARAVTDAGLTWIGPPPESIVQMGDKLSARRAAEAAGCPVVPGTLEPTQDPDVVRQFAAEHGFPVAIKAAYGGGGRGLKVVRDDDGLVEALEGAQREAVTAFGRGEVYVERYLTRPRHIEIQVLADTHGTYLWLGERDCSSQRRHQKLIEEAPAPGFDPDIRRAMGDAAVRVSEQVGYEGAGTCEFLYEDGDFYFLEMNTRLQVEHPVTELVTGLDLVHWQLRIAAGEPLPFGQENVVLRGHAIEARINAENVAMNFAPAAGLITGWQPPSGAGVRVDAGVEEGWEIPRSYDSLIAKLITYGSDRDDARRKMIRALDEFVVEGVPTTIDFHRFAMRQPDFIDGNVSTVTVEREWDLSPIAAAEPATAGAGAQTASRTLTVEVGGKRLEVALFEPDAADGAPATARRERRSARGAGKQRSGGTATETLIAPMQGTIVKTVVDVGQSVAAGDLILVLEAMKMENHISAHRDGVVTQLHVEAGQVVDSGEALATIEDQGGDRTVEPLETS